MNPTHAAAKNHLLAALPAKDLERWLPHLEAEDMPLGGVYEAGTVLRHVYFPRHIDCFLVVRDAGR